MTRPANPVDAFPVSLALLLAYATLAYVTRMFGDPVEFGERLQQYGVLTPAAVADGEAWRLLASTFLHANLLHLVFNGMMLAALGPGLEPALGSLRFAALYVVSALGGSVAVCLLYEPGQPVLGGSGALFGLMGAAVALNMRSGRHVFAFLDFEGPRRLLGTIAANLVLGFLIPMVSNTAHVGGLVAGFVVTWLWLAPARRPGPGQRRWRFACAAAFATLLLWSVFPVTRADWLQKAYNRELDPARAAQLRDALRLAAPPLGPRRRR